MTKSELKDQASKCLRKLEEDGQSILGNKLHKDEKRVNKP